MSTSKATDAVLSPVPLPERAGRKTHVLTFFAPALPILIVGILALTREFMTYGTETDYLGGFVPEAERILRGEPLRLEFHPPLYSFVIAAVWLAVREWFATGLIVSVLAGAGLAVVSYSLFRRVGGTAAGTGAVIGLLASPVFLAYSAFATSDVFFTFLYVATFLLGITALETGSRGSWLACGIVAGLALLTRTNGIAALVILIAPALAASRSPRARLGDAGLIALGVALPLTVWALYAALSGSRLAPALTHGSLAQTYFAEADARYAGPVRLMFEARFSGVWEVLLYDPLHVAKTYLRDLLVLTRRIFGREQLLAFPLNHLAVPGLLVLLVLRARPVLWLVAGAAALHVLLLNFKPFESRFYLFLVPLLGAAALASAEGLRDLARTQTAKGMLRAAVAMIAIGAIVQGVFFAYLKLHKQDELLAEITQARASLAPDAQVLAMRPHAAFYLGAGSLFAARIDSVHQLADLLHAHATRGPVYVYIGDDERRWWGFTGSLERMPASPAWLVQVAGSSRSEHWALYAFRPEATEVARP